VLWSLGTLSGDRAMGKRRAAGELTRRLQKRIRQLRRMTWGEERTPTGMERKAQQLRHARRERSAKTDWGGSLQSAPMTDPEPGGLGGNAGSTGQVVDGAHTRRRRGTPAHEPGAPKPTMTHPAPALRVNPGTGRANAATPKAARDTQENDREELTTETANNRRAAEFRSAPVSRAATMDAREIAPGFCPENPSDCSEARPAKAGSCALRTRSSRLNSNYSHTPHPLI
jgi:hypothetical protein